MIKMRIEHGICIVIINGVSREGDTFITVRDERGQAVTIPEPFDKSLSMNEPWNGMGTIRCPVRLLK